MVYKINFTNFAATSNQDKSLSFLLQIYGKRANFLEKLRLVWLQIPLRRISAVFFRLTMKGCLHVRRSAVKILRILPQEAVEMMIIVDFVSITWS